eukprot:7542922-Lingulodinium_polyedra.AAC.1
MSLRNGTRKPPISPLAPPIRTSVHHRGGSPELPAAGEAQGARLQTLIVGQALGTSLQAGIAGQ